MGFKTCFLLLLVLSNIVVGFQSDPFSDFSSSDLCPKLGVTCLCNELQVRLYLNTSLIESRFKGSRCLPIMNPWKACSKISCSFTFFPHSSNVTASSAQNVSTILENKEVDLPQLYMLPLSNDLDALNRSLEKHRHSRQIEVCHTFDLENAIVTCYEWPNYLVCNIQCRPGYAFEGTNKTYHSFNVHCRDTENIWKPHNYEDCKPYMLCHATDVKLVAPGKIQCHKPVTAPLYCDIECYDHGIFEATELQRYECLDDAFGGYLPHCIDYLDSHVQLVDRPDDDAGVPMERDENEKQNELAGTFPSVTLLNDPELTERPRMSLTNTSKPTGHQRNLHRKRARVPIRKSTPPTIFSADMILDMK